MEFCPFQHFVDKIHAIGRANSCLMQCTEDGDIKIMKEAHSG